MKIGFDCMVVTTPYLIGVENSQKSVINQMGSDRVIPVRTPVIEELVRTIQQTEQQLNRYLTGNDQEPFDVLQDRIPNLSPEHLHTKNSQLVTNFVEESYDIQEHTKLLKDMHGKFTQSNSSSKKKDRKQKKLAEQNGEPTRVQRILLKQASKPCELSVNYEIDPKKILRAFCDSEIMKPLNDAGELSIIWALHEIARECLKIAPKVPCHFVMFTNDNRARDFLIKPPEELSDNPLKDKILIYDENFKPVTETNVYFYAAKPTTKKINDLKDAILANMPHSFTR